MTTTNRHLHENANRKGWGVAGLVVLLAIVANVFIFWVHRSTFRDPADPMMRAAGAPPAGAPAPGATAGH